MSILNIVKQQTFLTAPAFGYQVVIDNDDYILLNSVAVMNSWSKREIDVMQNDWAEKETTRERGRDRKRKRESERMRERKKYAVMN